jgi:hypothetical protein
MSNTILDPTVISKVLAVIIRNKLVAAAFAYKEFKNEFVEIGDTLTYRKPVIYNTVAGPDITSSIKDMAETSDTIQIDTHRTVPLQVTMKEWTLSIEKFTQIHLVPAGVALANYIDAELLNLYSGVYNYTGVAGTTPATAKAFNNPRKILNRFSTPPDKRVMILDGEAGVEAGQVHKGLFLPPEVGSIIREGMVGRLYGFDMAESENIKTHTAGTPGGTPLVDGAAQSGSTLNIKGMTATTGDYHAGDIITIANVNSVNRLSKEDTGQLQPFVITALGTADGSGDLAASISPAIVLTGDYQNVATGPADNAAITLIASHQANLAFRKDAIALVTVPFKRPESAVMWGQADYDGISVTISKGFDVLTYKEITRLDVQFGVKLVYPDFACRVLG